MSNVMSMANIRNHTSRNSFDLSCKRAFTAKVGQLLPVLCKEILPGDYVDIDIEHFTRTAPVESASFTRMREYYDFFFVPAVQNWDNFDTFITQMDDNSVAASLTAPIQNSKTIPHFNTNDVFSYINALYVAYTETQDGRKQASSDIFSFSRAHNAVRLLQYLGYGDYSLALQSSSNFSTLSIPVNLRNKPFNPLPLMAYQKIYNDFFRFSQWEKSQPWTFNLDFANNSLGNNVLSLQSLIDLVSTGDGTPTLFDLRYCNWNKDYFMGLLPQAQFGDASLVSGIVDGSNYGFKNGSSFAVNGTSPKFASDGKLSFFQGSNQLTADSLSGLTSQISILALRQAEFLQKWREIAQSGSQTYKDQLEKHWGVKISAERSGLVQYLGGSVSNLDIDEVMNQNLAEAQPDMRGKGVGSGRGHVSQEFKEHGFLICVYHCAPLLDFEISGAQRMTTRVYATDYAIPEFDKIGMEPVPVSELSAHVPSTHFGLQPDEEAFIGYAPRYYDYKTSYDEVLGAFRSQLSHWVAPLTGRYIETRLTLTYQHVGRFATYGFFKVSPFVVDSIFFENANSSVDTDQLRVNSFFDCKFVRNLDYDGLPY